MSLPPIPSISKLASKITRVLGHNPGPYTLQGTNTYLIGHPESLILLDTAQGAPAFIESLKTALLDHGPTARLKSIVLSHWHEDHIDGLKPVLELTNSLKMPPPAIYKFPAEKENDEFVNMILRSVPPEHFVAPTSQQGDLFHRLHEAQYLDETYKVIHTPGHTTDSISIVYIEEDRTLSLFTFDTILGHGTSIFENLGNYLRSLEKYLKVVKDLQATKVVLYPGHGEIIQEGLSTITEYIKHRKLRETQIIELLSDGAIRTATQIAQEVYNEDIPTQVLRAAIRGVLLHLVKLEEEDVVVRADISPDAAVFPGFNDSWKLLACREASQDK